MINEEKKNEYWEYFTKQIDFSEFTSLKIKSIEKIKPNVWDTDYFWKDILIRHGGNIVTPEEMKELDPFVYKHCMSNFGMMLSEIHKMVLPKLKKHDPYANYTR